MDASTPNSDARAQIRGGTRHLAGLRCALSPSTATGGCSSKVDRFDSTEIFPATLAQNPPAVAQHLSVTARHNRQLSTASTPCDDRPLCPRRQRTHTVCRHRGALIMASRTDLPSTSPAWKPDSMTDTRCLADGALRGPAVALHAACGAIGGVGGASAWPQLPIFHLNTNLRLLAGSAVIKKGSPQARALQFGHPLVIRRVRGRLSLVCLIGRHGPPTGLHGGSPL